jgi:HlyD family secretion protein
VSRIRAGQTVGFTVDAVPAIDSKQGHHRPAQHATTNNNVVTYQVVADVPNPDLRLMPGMTATIGIEIWQANDVLRIPSAALRCPAGR